MGGGGGSNSRSLAETPTWALATVSFVFIFLGLLIEYLMHLATHWLKKRKKAALFEATEKLKSVLMLLGFMSLLLTVTQRSISKICVSNKVANSMLPCRSSAQVKATKNIEHLGSHNVKNQILNKTNMFGGKRELADSASASASDNYLDHCSSKGMYSLISQEGINQLNVFIFVLAAMQIVYSIITIALGRAKMKRWKAWERETQTVEYMAANDPERFRYTRQTTFGRRHVNSCSANSAMLWVKCFFRQFFRSVAKIDYLTLRHGFITAHLSTNYNSFNFQKYIKRSLEDDFKAVVGMRPIMWFIVVIFLLVDVHGWNVYLWVSFLPLVIVLVIGTKLEVIVGTMAMQLTNQNTVIKGTPLVQPNNDLFWFNSPQLVLTLIHFTLFMNAFELAFFIWVTWQFGIKSCYHENVEVIVTRVVLAVMVQILCSYITLPLYALVTQMGSQFKSSILEEHTLHALKQWHTDVQQRKKKEPGDPSIVWSNSRTVSVDETLGSPGEAEFVSPKTASADEITHYVDHDNHQEIKECI